MGKSLGISKPPAKAKKTSEPAPRKKKIGLSGNQSISGVENKAGGLANKALNARFFNINTINIDPHNPRELLITPKLVKEAPTFDHHQVLDKGPQYESALSHFKSALEEFYTKNLDDAKSQLPKTFCGVNLNWDSTDSYIVKRCVEEHLSVFDLSCTLDSPEDLIEPVVIRESPITASHFILIAGERRYLAHIVRNHSDILGLKRDIKDTQIAVWQWRENTDRDELTLSQELNNIYKMCSDYCLDNNLSYDTNPVVKIPLKEFMNLVGLAKTYSSYYRKVLSSSDERLFLYIGEEKINSLKVAFYLAKNPTSPLFGLLETGRAVTLSDLDLIDADIKIKTQEENTPAQTAKQTNTKQNYFRFNKISSDEIDAVRKMLDVLIEHLPEERKSELQYSENLDGKSITRLFNEMLELYSEDKQ